jgi:hypothetical protein
MVALTGIEPANRPVESVPKHSRRTRSSFLAGPRPSHRAAPSQIATKIRRADTRKTPTPQSPDPAGDRNLPSAPPPAYRVGSRGPHRRQERSQGAGSCQAGCQGSGRMPGLPNSRQRSIIATQPPSKATVSQRHLSRDTVAGGCPVSGDITRSEGARPLRGAATWFRESLTEQCRPNFRKTPG